MTTDSLTRFIAGMSLLFSGALFLGAAPAAVQTPSQTQVWAVSRQTVNAVETGKYDPSLPLAFRIADTFGQPIEESFEPDDAGSRQ